MTKDAAVAFRVSDDDLSIIDDACKVQMINHPGTCSRNDIYRRGGLDLARRILADDKRNKASDTDENTASTETE